MTSPLHIASLCVADGVPRRSLAVALVVGSLLNLINQWEAFLGRSHFDLAKLALTFIVPYCVATYGAVAYRLQLERQAGGRETR